MASDNPMIDAFDPDAPADHEGLFGLPHGVDDARVVVVPVPMEATTSFGGGTSGAPAAILEASYQVDLSLPHFGDPWRAGIALDNVAPAIAEACAAAAIAASAAREGDPEAFATVNRSSAQIAEALHDRVDTLLSGGQIPAILGGDHSVPLGAIQAAAARHPGLGILHVDAHADLRMAYEGFEQSHASIFFNVLKDPAVANVLQVGLRDLGRAERTLADREPRIRWLTDDDLRRAVHRGESVSAILGSALKHLPETIWVSFDIDGLEPALCPGTGTPVPGGLTWHEAMTLLELVAATGRRVVGFDLCEVGPGEWDANVGARLLYTLCGLAVLSQGD